MENKTEQKITKKTILNGMIDKNPEVIPILLGYGLHCVGCSFSSFDTIESGAKIHGMDGETLKMMIRDLNTIVSEGIKN